MSVTPYLLYEDTAAAMDFLAAAFGFEERFRLGQAGVVYHAEMALGEGAVMMGSPGPDYKNPARQGQRCCMIHVYVPDVDAHFLRAKAAGAKIVSEPEDQFYGDRRYEAEDTEGNLWSFATKVRDVSIEEMKAAMGG